ncbi:MAG: hypothetical protein P4L87_15060 [Formivibrio sp.]|nr:hypothetical protein [Formivibrio sp.]
MQEDVDFDYLHEVTLPIQDDVKVFGVGLLFDAIVEEKQPCIHNSKAANPLPSSDRTNINIENIATNTATESIQNCKCAECHFLKRCTYYRNEYKQYLARNIVTLVKNGDIELWNMFAQKKKVFTDNYDPYLVSWTTNIFRNDAIKFCKKERILLRFQSQKAQVVNQEMQATNKETKTINQDDNKNEKSNKQKSGNLIPGKCPRVYIRKLVVKAAWEIECETGSKASARKVIEILKRWRDDGTYTNLQASTGNSVKWCTNKGKEHYFDVKNCGDALNDWHKTRIDGQSFDSSEIC